MSSKKSLDFFSPYFSTNSVYRSPPVLGLLCVFPLRLVFVETGTCVVDEEPKM